MFAIMQSTLISNLFSRLLAFKVCVILFLLAIVSANFENKNGITESTLRLVHGIFRHGEKNPDRTYSSDPYNNLSYWPDGWGQLTRRGRFQQFHLGQIIRQRYNGFISNIYNEKEVCVQSSEYNRTIISAQAVLAGLYGESEDNSEMWPQFNITIIPLKEDKTIRVSRDCPQYVKLYIDFNFHSDIMQKFNNDNKDIYSVINDNTGLNITYLSADLAYFINNLIIKKERNLTVSSWEESLYNSGRLKEIINFQHLTLGYTLEMKRLKGGPLLKEIFMNINNAIEDRNKFKENETKMYLYSGHDTTVADLLNSFGLYNIKNFVGYSSTVFLELHQLPQTNTFYIKIFYRSDSSNDALEFEIPNCSFPCEVNILEENVKNIIPENWEQECESGVGSVQIATDVNLHVLAAFVYGFQSLFLTNFGI